MPEPAYKYCVRCDQTKPVQEFHKNRSKPDGLGTECRLCAVVISQAWAKANPKRISEANRRYREKHPEKTRAHGALNRALRRGEVTRPDLCQRCAIRRNAVKRLHAHHHDYEQPLKVEWLCPRCHAAEHS